MALITTFSVPKPWLARLLPDFDVKGDDTGWLRSEVRRLLNDAAMSGIQARPDVPAEPGMSVNVSLAEPAAGAIRARARECGLTAGPYCRALLAGLLAQPSNMEATTMQAEGVLAEVIEWGRKTNQDIEPRAEQAMFYGQLRDALSGRHIGLCEAATGVGKTLAMLCAAVEKLREQPGRATIAAPTIALMRHFAATYRAIQGAIDAPELRVVVGRREFVSPNEVRALLGTGRGAFDVSRVHAWLDRGGAPEAASDPLGLPWLASSLAAACPDFPVHEVLLPEVVSRDDPGFVTYRSQFDGERDRDREIMLVTHAMLTHDIRRRNNIGREDEELQDLDAQYWEVAKSLRDMDGEARATAKERLTELSDARGAMIADLSYENGLLPPYTLLLVDEAHLLEQNASSALSEYVSLRAFARALEEFRAHGGRLAADHLKNINAAIDRLSDLGQSITRDPQSLAAPEGLSARFASLIRQVADEARQLKAPQEDAPARLAALYVRIRRDIATLAAAGRQDGNSRGFLQFSPIRAWPQLYLARANVKSLLTLLWSYVPCGAAVSATLYLRKGEGFSASYQRMLLAIPPHRAKEYQPVVPAWLVRPVQGLWTPASVATDAARGWWLRPPTQKDKFKESVHNAEEDAWLGEVCEAVQRIYQSAAGGVLVLMTSYASVQTLSALLAPSLRDCMIVAEPGWRVHEQQATFERRSVEGVRPLWIAVGSAWTGIDIGGHNHGIPAGEDNMMTDIVIPCLPFGTNRSMTHQYRMSHEPGVPWDVLDAAFRTKQALGRLVRRAGLPHNRRLFVLDGRLADPDFQRHLTLIRGILDRYKPAMFTRKD